jgi:hypothetical protein
MSYGEVTLFQEDPAMTIFFLAGSLTLGAALVFGLTEVEGMMRLLCGVATVVGSAYIWATRHRVMRVKTQKAYRAHLEADRFDELDVKQMFDALSEAKAKSMAPFDSRRSDY